MGKMDEMILAARRVDIFGGADELAFQGVHTSANLLAELDYIEKRRGDLEDDPKYKQLITYTIVEAVEDKLILLYQRIGGGDDRLAQKTSIGVGGHANEVEGSQSLESTLRINALRELQEELHFESGTFDLQPIGFLNDDSDEVGRVHVGVIYHYSVPTTEGITVAETDTLELRWVTREELKQEPNLESWSKLLVPYI